MSLRACQHLGQHGEGRVPVLAHAHNLQLSTQQGKGAHAWRPQASTDQRLPTPRLGWTYCVLSNGAMESLEIQMLFELGRGTGSRRVGEGQGGGGYTRVELMQSQRTPLWVLRAVCNGSTGKCPLEAAGKAGTNIDTICSYEHGSACWVGIKGRH